VGSNPTPGTIVGVRRDHLVVPHIRSQETVDSALRASDLGMPDAENAHQQGVAVKTIRRWRREYQRRGKSRGREHLGALCPRCDEGALDVARRNDVQRLDNLLGLKA
jgi:transposase-like protein